MLWMPSGPSTGRGVTLQIGVDDNDVAEDSGAMCLGDLIAPRDLIASMDEHAVAEHVVEALGGLVDADQRVPSVVPRRVGRGGGPGVTGRVVADGGDGAGVGVGTEDRGACGLEDPGLGRLQVAVAVGVTGDVSGVTPWSSVTTTSRTLPLPTFVTV